MLSLHLKQSHDDIKPAIRRAIIVYLQDKHKTHCKNIHKTFKEVFAELSKKSEDNRAAHTNVDTVDNAHSITAGANTFERQCKDFFGPRFKFDGDTPPDKKVEAMARYYIWQRAKGQRFQDGDSPEARDRRDLMREMFAILE